MIIFSSLFGDRLNNRIQKRFLTNQEMLDGVEPEFDTGPYNYENVKQFYNGRIAQRVKPLKNFDIIYIPVMYEGHWILFIHHRIKDVVYLNNSIDRYCQNALNEVIKRVRNYLMDAKLASAQVRFESVPSPQQIGGYDCGLFVIRFLRKALSIPEDNFPEEFKFSREDLAVDLLSLKINASSVL
jgi:Ulp1 family protease